MIERKCSRIEVFLVPYLLDELTPRRRKIVGVHLRSCVECRRTLSRGRALIDVLPRVVGEESVLPSSEASPRVDPSVDSPGGASRVYRRLIIWGGGAAAAGVLVGAMILGGGILEEPWASRGTPSETSREVETVHVVGSSSTEDAAEPEVAARSESRVSPGLESSSEDLPSADIPSGAASFETPADRPSEVERWVASARDESSSPSLRYLALKKICEAGESIYVDLALDLLRDGVHESHVLTHLVSQRKVPIDGIRKDRLLNLLEPLLQPEVEVSEERDVLNAFRFALRLTGTQAVSSLSAFAGRDAAKSKIALSAIGLEWNSLLVEGEGRVSPEVVPFLVERIGVPLSLRSRARLYQLLGRSGDKRGIAPIQDRIREGLLPIERLHAEVALINLDSGLFDESVEEFLAGVLQAQSEDGFTGSAVNAVSLLPIDLVASSDRIVDAVFGLLKGTSLSEKAVPYGALRQLRRVERARRQTTDELSVEILRQGENESWWIRVFSALLSLERGLESEADRGDETYDDNGVVDIKGTLLADLLISRDRSPIFLGQIRPVYPSLFVAVEAGAVEQLSRSDWENLVRVLERVELGDLDPNVIPISSSTF